MLKNVLKLLCSNNQQDNEVAKELIFADKNILKKVCIIHLLNGYLPNENEDTKELDSKLNIDSALLWEKSKSIFNETADKELVNLIIEIFNDES